MLLTKIAKFIILFRDSFWTILNDNLCFEPKVFNIVKFAV